MDANFITLDSAEKLSDLISASHTRPVVLFKHSTTCGISSGVYRAVSAVDGDIHMVVMQTHRPLAMEIAQLTGIRHESPQAIVLKDGLPVYAASHYDIEPEKLNSFLM